MRISDKGPEVALTLLILFTGFCLHLACRTAPPTSPPDETEPYPPQPPALSSQMRELLDLHNEERVALRLPRLAVDARLMHAAEGHADWMANNAELSHIGEGGSSFSQRIYAQGYPLRGGGENIAAGQRDAKAAHQAWMNSAGHRRNILNQSWRDVGLACHESDGGRLYWCVVFGYTSQDGQRSATRDHHLPEPLDARQAPQDEAD